MSFKIEKKEVYRATKEISFPYEEELILKYWHENHIFENGQELSRGRPHYVFYDGPPFATGLPHYGHILAGTIKDVVTRFAYQQGYHVERTFGWDCHGLPIEYEIDKLLGIKSPRQVDEMGIAIYNQECRNIVMRYADEWKRIVGRMGRWIDFDNDYKTMYPWYMESVWWTFKQLFEKGLVYQGVKVMPFSTKCATPLSNFEAGQNYRQVQDLAVVVALEIVDDVDKTSFLVWTTTPWTLPANLAVCVNPELWYVKLKSVEKNRFYILAESRMDAIFTRGSCVVVDNFQGYTLCGLKYKPVFPYFTEYAEKMNGFRVLQDEYVSSDQGTGIVHQAPYFGEDDYRICLKNGIISKTNEVICPVDDSGCFIESVIDFAGQYIKDAEKNIIGKLKETGALFSAEQILHSYPFCWRSDTPLIYKAVPSWFIRVEQMSEALLANTAETNWIPEFVRDNRFGNWLKDAKDWAVSRNRFWGTPIPIWTSVDGTEVVCIGSVAELERLSGKKVADLHRQSIDHIEIPSTTKGNPNLKRVEQVFDCWFESGSMPFAQKHFPFKNSDNFSNHFPADFVAEGIDQTRGWFYTLLVISSALFDQAPFKNVIVNGLVLASDGQKMSKRKKNYPDPMDIFSMYGADALRLYLINSPVVRAENLKFREDGVRDILKDILIPWYNAFRFLTQNIHRLEEETKSDYVYHTNRIREDFQNLKLIDRWILSYKETLLQFVAGEMGGYRLYTVVPRLIQFVGQLTNWYIRLNRQRLRGDLGNDESARSIYILFDVLSSMTKVMAPFTPFFSEYLYHRLIVFEKKYKLQSVHHEMTQSPRCDMIDHKVEQSVHGMQKIIELGRIIRNRRNVPLRHPVPEIVIINRDKSFLDGILSFEKNIKDELNVKRLTLGDSPNKFGIEMKAKPDYKLLGSKFKSKLKTVAIEIDRMTNAEIQKLLNIGFCETSAGNVDLSELKIAYEFASKWNHCDVEGDSDILVVMDMSRSEQLQREGVARDLINRIQKLKKSVSLLPTDPAITFYYLESEKDNSLSQAIDEFRPLIEKSIKSPFQKISDLCKFEMQIFASDRCAIDNEDITIFICRPYTRKYDLPIQTSQVDVYLSDSVDERYCSKRHGTVFLKHPSGEYLSLDEFRKEIDILFGLYAMNIVMKCEGKNICNIQSLESKHVYVYNGVKTE